MGIRYLRRLTSSCLAALVLAAVLACIALFPSFSLAAIPLITDDTGTQGKGRFQAELLGETGQDKHEQVTTKANSLVATLTYGVADPLDVAVIVPYQFFHARDSGSTSSGDGIGDVAIETKWRFYDREGESIALKPGFTIPTGNDEKGLGNGKVAYYLNLIASKEVSPWAFHLNLAYFRNENSAGQRKGLWHASIASTVAVMKDLKLAADAGLVTSPDPASKTPPAYVLGGIIYSVSDNFDIGLGVKGGLTRPEMDVSIRGGITWRF